ncbi:hypothetical protein NED98_13130 [Sphingomonas sp. MMSM20]|uniref:hypothetical protein n=1 Tax=Sphingomonas lycopersici TaxID=2951807 RepID=UPI00223827EE|nr:hypothetical protein [Sphingomonas lycopersici]MCW6531189.1 hypothetical protein [Sphingomonas lycopersici]
MATNAPTTGARLRAPAESAADARNLPPAVVEYLAAKDAYDRAWTKLLETHNLEFGLASEVPA